MTAYARTLLKQSHYETREGTDSAILATLGSLEARVVDASNLLNETSCQLAVQNDVDAQSEFFIVITEKQTPTEIMALCRMTLAGHMHSNKKLKAIGLSEQLEIEFGQAAPRLLTIAPFEFTDKNKAHRAQGLLWQAIARFCTLKNVDYVIGSLAFNSRYPAAHALELSYLYHFCRSQSGVLVKANHGVTMDIMPEEAIRPNEAFSSLPPMLRYCLRIGAKVGENAIVDHLKNQTRVLLLFSARSIYVRK